MAYPPKTSLTPSPRAMTPLTPPATDASDAFTTVTTSLSVAQSELNSSAERLSRLESKITTAEVQLHEWHAQLAALQASIKVKQAEKRGYEELLPVAQLKVKTAAQRVERLQAGLKKFERDVKFEEYLKELEMEEDINGGEKVKRYWTEVGDGSSPPSSPTLSDDKEFDDLAKDEDVARPRVPIHEPVVLVSVQPDELESLVNERSHAEPVLEPVSPIRPQVQVQPSPQRPTMPIAASPSPRGRVSTPQQMPRVDSGSRSRPLSECSTGSFPADLSPKPALGLSPYPTSPRQLMALSDEDDMCRAPSMEEIRSSDEPDCILAPPMDMPEDLRSPSPAYWGPPPDAEELEPIPQPSPPLKKSAKSKKGKSKA